MSIWGDTSKLNSEDFTSSDFISYLSMIFYAASGKEDDARIDFGKITDNGHLAYAPEDGKGRVNFISLEGIIPTKVEKTVTTTPFSFYTGRLDVPYIGIKTAWPVIPNVAGSSVTSVDVKASNGQSVTLKLLESFTDTARKALEKNTRSMYLRSFYRGYMKMTAIAAAEAKVLNKAVEAADTAFAKMQSNKLTRLLANSTKNAAYAAAIGVFVKSLEAVNDAEKADVRMGQFLPDKSSAGTLSMAPGRYDFTVTYHLANGKSVQKVIQGVEVKAGESEIVVSSCLL